MLESVDREHNLRGHILFLNLHVCHFMQLICLPKGHAFHLFIWVLRHFQHCTGHITMNTFVGRGNQHTQLFKVL